MSKKVKLKKSDIESIRDIVELLTKRKSKKRKSKGKKGKTTSTKKDQLTQQNMDNVGPKLFSSFTPNNLFTNPNSSNLFRNPFQQPVMAQPTTVPTPTPTKPTDWDEMFKKLVEAQTKAYTTPSGITPSGITPSGKTPTTSSSSSSSSSSTPYNTPFRRVRAPPILAPIKINPVTATTSTELDDGTFQNQPLEFEQIVENVQQNALKNVSSKFEPDNVAAIAASSSSSFDSLVHENQKQKVDEVKAALNDDQKQEAVSDPPPQPQQPQPQQGYLVPGTLIWSTGKIYTDTILNPSGRVQQKMQPGNKDVINNYEVGFRSDTSVWLKDDKGKWNTESGVLTSPVAAGRFEIWKKANKNIFIFPQDVILPDVPKARNPARPGFPK